MNIPDAHVSRFVKVVALSCNADKRLLPQHTRLPWLQVMDGLLTLARCNSSAADNDFEYSLSLWRQFGNEMHINEDELRSEIASRRKTEMNGCSWLRCPLFDSGVQVSERDPFLCPRCRTVSKACSAGLVVAR